MPLSRTSPSAVGVDAQGVLDLLDAAAHLQLHSIAIAREGEAFARGWWAPYRPDRKHLLYSCSKSVTATTIASLAADGLLGLDDPVLDRLPTAALAAAGEIAEVWRRVTVRHCLTMTVGHAAEAWADSIAEADEPLVPLLANPPDGEPGTVFAYNQVATYLLSRVAENVTGSTLDVLAFDRVLGPLGATDLDWERDAAGHPFGFTGARVRTDDLHALAQLWLDGGTSGARGIVPSAWVAEASRPFLPVEPDPASDWANGYGQSFWIARHGYRADGAYGQYGIVLPEQRVTVAITSEVLDMQEPLDLLWQHLLPAIDRAGSPDADARLAERLAELSLPALSGAGAQPEPRTWPVDPGSDLTTAITAVDVDADGSTLTLVRDGGDLTFSVGNGAWVDSEATVEAIRLPASASGGWDADGGFSAEVRLVETPHSFRVTAGPGGALLRWRYVPLHGDDPLVCAVP